MVTEPRVRSRLLSGVVGALLVCTLAFFGSVSPSVGGTGGTGFGPVPQDCGAVHLDFTNPTCTAQTRNGTFILSPHVVAAGGTLTGTITNRCEVGLGNTSPCPIDWSGMLAIGKATSGCKQQSASCTVKVPSRAPTSKYMMVTVGITNVQGQGISKDYYAVVGKAGKLSVTAVDASSAPLSADIKVSFRDGLNGSAPCDPKATYNFSDAEIASATSLGSCSFRLKFDEPGTGIYHVALTASSKDGGVGAEVSKNQYGKKVNGTFPVIIESCKKPTQQMADIEALVNSQDQSCGVLIGAWDSDASSIPSAVLSAVQSSSHFDVDPVPVSSVDPSDWSAKDLALFKKRGTGYIPTGEGVLESGSFDASQGLDVGLVDKLSLPGVPRNWNGSGTPLTADQINNDIPKAYVVSAHGLWFTGNGLVRVPAGDSVTTYVPVGTAMGIDGRPAPEQLGLHVDTGDLTGDDTKYLHTYTAGQLMPDFTFLYYEGAVGPHAHPIQQGSPMTLNALLTHDQGPVWISACASVYVPAGETLAEALSLMPIHTAGSDGVAGWASATIANGQLHSSPVRLHP